MAHKYYCGCAGKVSGEKDYNQRMSALSSGVISMECWVAVSIPSAFSEITSMFFCLLSHANPCDFVSKLCVVTLPVSSLIVTSYPLANLSANLTFVSTISAG